ncbi:hypothetical protein HY213_00095 [Candidatus Peregrinibacteria bacterium]|nr:hypothetical protein [Candidatus Peregrinibacteria bacterium]
MEPRTHFFIQKKLKQYLSSPDPMRFAVSVVNLPPATHRFRAGDFRIKFFRSGNVFYLTSIERRDKVYR